MKTLYIKIIILFVFVSVLVDSCKQADNNSNNISTNLINNPISANGNKNTNTLPIIHFYQEAHNFGIILQGEKVKHNFKFKNIGKSDLLIQNASASCGCTVPKFPQKPIAPGEEGEIQVVFNSAHRSGHQQKTLTIVSNAQPNINRLKIECEIVVSK